MRQILEAKRRWPRPGHGPTGTDVLTIWARTWTGRALIVAVYQVGGFTWKIIGARGMTDTELAEFIEWEEAE